MSLKSDSTMKQVLAAALVGLKTRMQQELVPATEIVEEYNSLLAEHGVKLAQADQYRIKSTLKAVGIKLHERRADKALSVAWGEDVSAFVAKQLGDRAEEANTVSEVEAAPQEPETAAADSVAPAPEEARSDVSLPRERGEEIDLAADFHGLSEPDPVAPSEASYQAPLDNSAADDDWELFTWTERRPGVFCSLGVRDIYFNAVAVETFNLGKHSHVRLFYSRVQHAVRVELLSDAKSPGAMVMTADRRKKGRPPLKVSSDGFRARYGLDVAKGLSLERVSDNVLMFRLPKPEGEQKAA